MFHVEQSVEYERVGKVITHRDIQDSLLTMPYNPNKLRRDDAIYYLMQYNNEDVGICVILSVETFHFVDIGFLKKVRGKIGRKLALMCKEKFFANYPEDKLHAMISKRNKASLQFSKWIGFRVFSEDNDNFYIEVSKDGRSN